MWVWCWEKAHSGRKREEEYWESRPSPKGVAKGNGILKAQKLHQPALTQTRWGLRAGRLLGEGTDLLPNYPIHPLLRWSSEWAGLHDCDLTQIISSNPTTAVNGHFLVPGTELSITCQ